MMGPRKADAVDYIVLRGMEGRARRSTNRVVDEKVGREWSTGPDRSPTHDALRVGIDPIEGPKSLFDGSWLIGNRSSRWTGGGGQTTSDQCPRTLGGGKKIIY